MNRFIRILSAVLSAVCLTACTPKTEPFELIASAVPTNYRAWYSVETVSGETPLAYTMQYTVEETDGTIRVTGEAQEPYEAVINGETVEGTQSIKLETELAFGQKAPYGLPISAKESFANTAVESQYTAFSCSFDHDAGYAVLKTRVYDASSETGIKEQIYTISLNEQYFEKDTLPFLLAGFPENDRTISVASGNRDKLQSIRVEAAQDETLTVPAGTFSCRVFVLRPATVFAVTSARVWIDKASGVVVQVEQERSCMTLKQIEK